MKIKIKTEYFYLIIFALCFISYQLIQDNIRPNYKGDNLTLKYFLGVAPNFFPAIGIPALFVVFIPYLNQNNNTSKWLNNKKHITANVLSLVGLISWEFIQMTSRKLKFDWNDVLWTLIGGLIFHLIWKVTSTKYNNEEQ